MEASSLSRQTSVVICVKNGEDIIKPALESVLRNNPFEVVVVDGQSTDRTVEIVRGMNIAVVSDSGRGIACARRAGVENTSGRWVMFVGPDNVLPDNFIEQFLTLKQRWGFHAASAQTRVLSPKTYWDRGMDFRYVCTNGEPGPRTIVGTPSVYDHALFNEVQFSDQDFGGADDTDVAEQLLARGYKLGVVPLLVHEQPGSTMKMMWKRFRWYGTGDYCFYHRYQGGWSFRRKLKSVFHPFRQALTSMGRAIRQGRIDLSAWLVFTMVARYKGWIEYALAGKTKHD